MPSYRFCRPDDLRLIVLAINECYRMHYPDMPEMTADKLKEHMTLFDVRPGNCMVALERNAPVGVVVSTKRAYGAWIQAIGCKPAVQRQGVASQLLEALIRKIAIQKTPDIAVDVPENNVAARSFFVSNGFDERGRYVSYQGPLLALASPCFSGQVEVVPAPGLLVHHAPFHAIPACWERHAESLAAYGSLPQGAVYREQGEVCGYVMYWGETILDLAVAPQADALTVSRALLGAMQANGITQATLPKVPDTEPLRAVLPQCGLQPITAYLLMGQALQ